MLCNNPRAVYDSRPCHTSGDCQTYSTRHLKGSNTHWNMMRAPTVSML